MTELLGWASSAVLLATLARQVRKQWREGTAEGVSRWWFGGGYAIAGLVISRRIRRRRRLEAAGT